MKKGLIIFLVVVGVLLIVGIGFYGLFKGTYNNMVERNEQIDGQWAQVENSYQRRADLIPNLVSTVKGYADFEQETLTQVIEARAKATSVNINPENMTPDMLQQFQSAQDGLGSALSRLMVVVEQYPELKANTNFLDLQAQLEGTENRISLERRKFNEVTQSYNAYIKKFPQFIFANWYNFEPRPYFKSIAGAETAPEVQF